MTYFLKSGNTFRPANEEALDLHRELPAGNYIIKADQYGQLFLEKIESFEIAGKVYGNTARHTERIYNTFIDRKPSTGVLLVGEKGSGKTLLAKSLSIHCAANQIPTIMVNSAWTGDKFSKLIQDISQPCMILFDEFEKTYDRDQQEEILTLLDGVYQSKKLFVLTCNDKWRIDEHMKNRPGRIFYLLEFESVDEQFVKEYCEDNLIVKSYASQIVHISKVFAKFNFDMLKALVEEVNRYNETPRQAIEMLNAKPEYDGDAEYEVKLKIAGNFVASDRLRDKTWKGNPLRLEHREEIEVVVFEKNKGREREYYTFTEKDLKKYDQQSGAFVFVNDEGDELHLTKIKFTMTCNPLAF